MKLENLFFARKKQKEQIPSNLVVDDVYAMLLGVSNTEVFAENTDEATCQTTTEFLQNAEMGRQFQSSMAKALSVLTVGGQTVASMLGHGGLFCAHCVTSVGTAVGSAGKGFGELWVPGLGGHYHEDGTFHEKEHKLNTSSFSSTLSPSSDSLKVFSSPRTDSSSTSSFNFFALPQTMLSLGEVFGRVFGAGEAGVSIEALWGAV